MVMRIFSFLLLLSIAFVPYTQANAQDENTQSSEEPEFDSSETLLETQREMMREKITNAMKTLQKDEISHFMVVYANYAIYSMVKTVKNDIAKAVQACVENNPDMTDELTSRFGEWKSTVGQDMEKSKSNIDNLVLAQSYMPQAEYQQLFSLVDETRIGDLNTFQKIPVTTPEACGYMLSKMDETEEQMSMMLKSTIKSHAEIMKKMQE